MFTKGLHGVAHISLRSGGKWIKDQIPQGQVKAKAGNSLVLGAELAKCSEEVEVSEFI